MSVAIVDYGSGNLHSAAKALERAVAREHGAAVLVTSDPFIVAEADRIVLPGVGAFADCKRGLDAIPGLVDALDEAVRRKGRPAARHLRRHAAARDAWPRARICDGLGWIEGDVAAITPADPVLKIPHMGWNTLDVSREHAVLAGLPTGPDGWHAYFVHSYGFRPPTRPTRRHHRLRRPADGDRRARHDRRHAIPSRKSQALGLALLANFLRWAP